MVKMLKQMCLDLSGLPVQCHMIPLPTSPCPLPSLLPPPLKNANGKRQSDLNALQILKPGDTHPSLISLSVPYVLCTVISLSCVPPLMNKFAR